jgi:hypothetical protein
MTRAASRRRADLSAAAGIARNRKGPALLPAPLSPASTVRTALLPPCGRSRTIRRLAAVMRYRAPASAFRTLGASLPLDTLHRDARRIGPRSSRAACWSLAFGSFAPVALVGRSAPFGVPDRQRLLPAVPAGDGPRQGKGGCRSTVPSTWRFQPDRCVPSARLPLRDCSRRLASLPCLSVSSQSCRSRLSGVPFGPRRSGQR